RAWAVVCFAEQLEYFDTISGQQEIISIMEKAARATCDFYIENTASDGVPVWDTGAPNIPDEPVDSSAAAIGAQGLLRLGRRLNDSRYTQAGLAVCNTIFDEPYLSTDPAHQGLILHSVYHRPNAWDWEPGVSSMWGDS